MLRGCRAESFTKPKQCAHGTKDLPESVMGQNRGTPVGIRTPNLLIRSQVLYPVELRVLDSRQSSRNKTGPYHPPKRFFGKENLSGLPHPVRPREPPTASCDTPGKALSAGKEARAGFEPAMEVLQTSALPLGHLAIELPLTKEDKAFKNSCKHKICGF